MAKYNGIKITEKLGITRQTLRNWVLKGLPHEQAGPKLKLYDFDQVIAWIKAQDPCFAAWIKNKFGV